jgi:hypothetical protein
MSNARFAAPASSVPDASVSAAASNGASTPAAALAGNSFERAVGAFTFGLTAFLPLSAGVCAFACRQAFENAVAETLVQSRTVAPAMTIFVYDHFKLALSALFVVTVLLTLTSFWQMWRERDTMVRLGRQYVLAVVAAGIALAFLIVFMGATAAALAPAR